MGYLCTNLLLAAALLVSGATHAGFRPEAGKTIGSITSVWQRGYDDFKSGVFVAYTDRGEIEFVGTQKGDDPYGDGEYGVLRSLMFGEPTAIAQGGGRLYVWDRDEHTLFATDIFGGPRRVLTTQFVEPSQIIASPEGHIFVIDKAAGGIFHIADVGKEYPPVYQIEGLSDLPDPRSIALLAWDTLSVLDGMESAIFNFKLIYEGISVRARPDRSFPLDRKAQRRIADFRAITAQGGTLYVADDNRVYTYVIEEDELVPATSEGLFEDIRSLAVTEENIYVLDGNEVKPIRKTIPIDLRLSAAPEKSQDALMRLYMYLDRHGLLPTRFVQPRRPQASLDEYLVQEGVLIAPEAIALVARSTGWFGFGAKELAVREDLSDGLLQFKYWLCRKNRALCAKAKPADVLQQPIGINQRIEVPFLEVRSYLQRRRVDLAGESVGEFLDYHIVNDRLRKSITAKTVKRFNSRTEAIAALPDDQVYSYAQKGSIVLPAETWTVTANIPSDEYYGSSEFDEIVQTSPGISAATRQRITRQTANSTRDSPETSDCAKIKKAHQGLLDGIGYPRKDFISQNMSNLAQADVIVGIVEKDVQTDRGHMVFKDEHGPAWRQVDEEGSLVTESSPSSFNATTSAAELGTFELKAHHGTHVAALIGGRKGPCWSGLLPQAKLILVDVSDHSAMMTAIDQAFFAGASVFNVSQELAVIGQGDTKGIEDAFTHQEREEVLFVVSAGNSDGANGVDLGDTHAKPYPAVLGDRQNVITVTSDFQQANYGKRYVDLISPGRDVMSATKGKGFAKATGTSQAAPFVTAAAAYLADTNAGAQTPSNVKARLIATANWERRYTGRVWGGALNFGDAVRHFDKTILRTHDDDTDKSYAVVRPKNRQRLKVESATLAGVEFYLREGSERADGNYLQSTILSLRRNGDDDDKPGLFRVVLKDKPSGKVKIILDAKLTGKIAADGFELLHADGTFARKSDGSLYFPGGVDIAHVKDYTLGMEYYGQINW